MLNLQILLSRSNEKKYDFYIFKHKIAYIFLQICDIVVKPRTIPIWNQSLGFRKIEHCVKHTAGIFIFIGTYQINAKNEQGLRR